MKTKKRKPKIHYVFQYDNEWIVKGATKLRISCKAKTKEKAISLGKEIARNQGSQLFLKENNKLTPIDSEREVNYYRYDEYKSAQMSKEELKTFYSI